jgi:hypothetical protein
MIVYWAMFLVPAAMGLLELASRPRRSYLGMKMAILLLLLVIAFRETGGDWPLYVELHELIRYSDLADAVAMSDPAYGLLNWLSAQFDAGLYGVNLVGALIYFAGFYRFATREQRPLLMLAVSIPYLVIVVVVGYSRQGIAIGLLLWGLSYLLEGRVWAFGAMCLLAATFHSTAIIMFPLVYFGLRLQGAKLHGGFQLAFLAVGGLLVLRDGLTRIEFMFIHYYESSHYSSQGALVRSFMSAAAALLLFWHWQEWGRRWPDRALWTAFAIAALACVPMTFVSSTTVDRLGLYLIPLQLIVASRLPVMAKTPIVRDATVIGVLFAYTLTLVVWLHFGQFASVLWLPYRSLLLGEIG